MFFPSRRMRPFLHFSLFAHGRWFFLSCSTEISIPHGPWQALILERSLVVRIRGVGMKIGILTGGGDCPGLNAVIRAVVRKGTFHYGDEFVGFLEGWRGVLEDMTMKVDLASVAGILPRGGTILRTS